MTLELTPAIITILDVHPHNAFKLICSVTTPADVISEKTIRWKLVKFMEVDALTNSVSTQISTYTYENGTRISILTATENEPGWHEIYCEAQLDILEDSSHIAANDMTAVTVKGKIESLL